MKIAIISDTHGLLDNSVIKYLQDADEIWHAGDIGEISIINQLDNLAGNLRAVSGNIDSHKIRLIAPQHQAFSANGARVLITHIGGSPPRYNKSVREMINSFKPTIVVCGHSHILKIMYDRVNKLLYINPGACGHHGFHHVRTMVIFEIKLGKPTNMKVIELGTRGRG